MRVSYVSAESSAKASFIFYFFFCLEKMSVSKIIVGSVNIAITTPITFQFNGGQGHTKSNHLLSFSLLTG